MLFIFVMGKLAHVHLKFLSPESTPPPHPQEKESQFRGEISRDTLPIALTSPTFATAAAAALWLIITASLPVQLWHTQPSKDPDVQLSGMCSFSEVSHARICKSLQKNRQVPKHLGESNRGGIFTYFL